MNPTSRRSFLQSSAVAGLGGLACSTGEEQAAARPPNVLCLYTDEHSTWSLGAYGGKLVDTPHLDSIASQGATFHNFFVNSAICTPSRGCFITGRYPHSHGAYRNNIELNRDDVTLAHCFQRAGYETVMLGKWHLDGEPRPGWVAGERSMGFGDCQWMFNRGHWQRIIERPERWPCNRSVAKAGGQTYIPEDPDGRPDMDYNVNAEGRYFTDWITDKTIEYLQRPRNNPFFCYLSIPDPHTPHTVGPPYDTMYKPEEMPVPETLYLEELPDWAAKARNQAARQDRVKDWRDPKRAELLQRRKAQYCGMVKCLDDNVGRILAALSEQGILDNTLILFSSDHGQYMGEHGIYHKNQLYETAHRVSLLMRLPDKISAATHVRECLATVDVQPTVLGLLGLPGSGREQGRDTSPLLHGDASAWRNEAFIHHSSLERAGIFTPEWEFALVEGADAILFDRTNDPDQTRNLYSDPKHKSTVDELTERVLAHNREVEAPALKWLEG